MSAVLRPLPSTEASPRSCWLPSLAEASPLSLFPDLERKGCWEAGSCLVRGSRWLEGQVGWEAELSVVEAEEVWSGAQPSISLGSCALQLLSLGKVRDWAPRGPVHRTCCFPPPAELNWPQDPPSGPYLNSDQRSSRSTPSRKLPLNPCILSSQPNQEVIKSKAHQQS